MAVAGVVVHVAVAMEGSKVKTWAPLGHSGGWADSGGVAVMAALGKQIWAAAAMATAGDMGWAVSGVSR
jgi:hypothetical protein